MYFGSFADKPSYPQATPADNEQKKARGRTVMRGYKIQQQGNQWQYFLIPNNNNNQPVARSIMYKSEKECEDGVKAFRKLVIENKIESIDSPHITIENQGNRLFLCYVMDGQIILKAGTYEKKQNCSKSAKSIFQHLDGYTLHRVTN